MVFEPFQLVVGMGNITGMMVPAILNPNNELLDESEGVSQRIVDAGSVEVAMECQKHKKSILCSR